MSAAQGEVIVLATVQGLVAERDRVRAAIVRHAPGAIALGVSPEAAENLLRYEPVEGHDPFEDLPDHDYVYSIRLREYGDVDLPPPDLLEAARAAGDQKLPLRGVDFPDETYEQLFTEQVSTLGFLRYGRIQRSLAKRPPKAKDAAEFCLAWDRKIRRVKGIRRVEELRERHMAEQALGFARETRARVLLVVDLARVEGVLAHLRASA